MTFQQFINSVQQDEPPAGCTRHLQALWEDAKGNWQQAHRIVQHLSDRDRDAAWIHAYLHRKEDDLSNAQYWYDRAGRNAAQGALSAEWEAIVKALLR